jgi:hypothetical protein
VALQDIEAEEGTLHRNGPEFTEAPQLVARWAILNTLVGRGFLEARTKLFEQQKMMLLGVPKMQLKVTVPILLGMCLKVWDKILDRVR